MLLDVTFCSAIEISNKTELSYTVVMHHLRLLYREGIVERKGSNKKYVWLSTGVGQMRLA
jgi:predicted transcriptional regulator